MKPTHPQARQSLSQDLYEEIRTRILDGTYKAGEPLPSTRTLAAERGWSRTTVSLVYDQLAADGFIHARRGAVSRVLAGVATAAHARPSRQPQPLRAGSKRMRLSAIGARIDALTWPEAAPHTASDIDFVYGPLSGQDFPTLAWMKAVRAVERQRSVRLAYEDPMGNLQLRQALHKHLSQTRGLSCSLDQVLIVNGSQQALDLCARLLLNPGDSVLVENPGYRMAHHVFGSYGAHLIGMAVDEQGMRTEQLAGVVQAQMVYVTPTHQFPLGGFLPMGRRRELLAWAARNGAWVVEDDYDSEYRYAVRPEPALQSLDVADSVIHVGTFSKTLSPQLRLGYMILPPPLVPVFAAAKRLSDRHTSTGMQRALAKLLEDGSYDRHVRRIRRHQQARQVALMSALSHYLGEKVRVQGAASGLHVVAWFPHLSADAEPALVQAALHSGVRVYPVSPLFLPTKQRTSKRPAGLVMGYALLEKEQIEQGIQRLAAALQKFDFA